MTKQMASELSSIAAWNEYMQTFLTELCETFPDCPMLFAVRDGAQIMAEQDEMSVLNKYIDEISPYAQALTDMDDQFFLTADIKFIKDLGVRKYWTPELDPETKSAIWQYLQTLLVMAQTIQSVPPQLLRLLEGYASKVTDQLGGQDPSQFDMHSLGMGAIQHMQQQDPAAFGAMFGNAEVPTRAELQETKPAATSATTTATTTATNGSAAPIGWDALRNATAATAARIPAPALPRPAPSDAPTWGQPQPPLHGNHPTFLPPKQ